MTLAALEQAGAVMFAALRLLRCSKLKPTGGADPSPAGERLLRTAGRFASALTVEEQTMTDESDDGVLMRVGADSVQRMERVMGIEPTLAAWEAAVLPLNYTRLEP
jgi:hypothetical protein